MQLLKQLLNIFLVTALPVVCFQHTPQFIYFVGLIRIDLHKLLVSMSQYVCFFFELLDEFRSLEYSLLLQ